MVKESSFCKNKIKACFSFIRIAAQMQRAQYCNMHNSMMPTNKSTVLFCWDIYFVLVFSVDYIITVFVMWLEVSVGGKLEAKSGDRVSGTLHPFLAPKYTKTKCQTLHPFLTMKTCTPPTVHKQNYSIFLPMISIGSQDSLQIQSWVV